MTDEELAALADQAAKTETITVTGSLIGRKEVDSPSPVSVVDKEKLESAGVTNVGDILQRIPAQGNAINAQNNNGGDGSTRINLRSIGTQRTLVLVNGRRVVASGLGADDSVDIGTIPLAMIERVEVLKDGASAIYGSDAIAGVVNIITRQNFTGSEASAYSSTSQKGDGTNYDLSFVTGQSSNKDNITFAAGYQKQYKIMAGDRKFSASTSGYDYETGAVTLQGSGSTPTGKINTYDSKGNQVLHVPGCTAKVCTADGNGGFRDFIPATGTAFNDAYNFQTLNYVVTPSSRINLFSNGHYEITKGVEAFYEAQFNGRKSEQQLAEEPISTATAAAPISANSYYNPFHETVSDYSRRLVEFGTRNGKQDVDTMRLVAGIKGTLPDELPVLNHWKWEASYNYGRSTSTNTTTGDLILSHLRAALGPSFLDTTDNVVKCGQQGAVIKGCVPINLLTPGNVSPEAIKYLTFTSINSGLNEQHVTQATLAGRLVELPNHGDISLAIGGDYRFEKGSSQTDPLTATGDTTGNASAPTAGSYHVTEGFGELSIVPVSGLEYLKWLEIDAAGRAYDYSTFGSGVTGKVSALARTVGGLALRGTYGNGFRAPTVSELFAGQADNFVALTDPCDTAGGTKMLGSTARAKCDAQGVSSVATFTTTQQRAKVGGNPNLSPEKAKNLTVGAVFEPLDNLDFTLDYWHIQIDNAIQSLPTATVLAQCYQGGLDNFCNLIQRDPATGVITYIYNLNQNVGAVTTSGLDFSAAYSWKNSLGTFRHAFEGTYLFKYNVDTGTVDPVTKTEQIIHGRNFYDLGVNPDWKFNLLTFWSHPSGLGAGGNLRFINGFEECDNDNCNSAENLRRHVKAYATGDLFVDYGFKNPAGVMKIVAGMNNVVNAQPPRIYNGSTLNADPSAYDFVGRQFYLRINQAF